MTRREEKIQVAINTLPWPRSEIVSLHTGAEAKKEGPKQYGIAQVDALGTCAFDPIEVQHRMVGRGATSTLTF